MPRARVYLSAIVLLSLVGGAAAAPISHNKPLKQPMAGPLDPTALHLRAGTIFLDAKTSLHASPRLRSAKPFPGGWSVIQLDGSLTPQRMRMLAAAGVRLGEYLPMNAYIVKLPAGFDAPRRLAGVPFVRWLGAFDKNWKIDPEIGLPRYQTHERLALAGQGRVKLSVVLFEGEDLNAALGRVGNMPGVVITDAQLRADNSMLELTMPAAGVAQLADAASVQWVEEAPEVTLRNDTNKWILQSNVPPSPPTTSPTPIWDHGIHGENQVGGHIDGGVRQTHCSFLDPSGAPIGPTHRKMVAYYGSNAAESHGTHTAGTFLGDDLITGGGTGQYRGMAYMARMAFTNLADVTSINLLSKLVQNHNATDGNGGRVHSNSWGNDNTTNYIAWCRDIDSFSYNNEDDVVAFACTNLNSAIKTPENAKNCLAVVLTSDTPNQGSQCISVGFAYTNDGRRKPEVSAPGCLTVSCNSGTTCGFTGSGFTGNSMACPAACGASLLVRQYYMDGFYPSGAANVSDARTPSGALIRATVTNSAVDMSGIAGFPSDREGWGRILLDNALYFSGDARKLIVLDDIRNAGGMTTGQNKQYALNVVTSAEPLKITLVWTEKEATANSNPAYINNLDLVVTAPGGTTYRGNFFSGGQAAASTSTADADTKDNTEQILLNSPATGAYIVQVLATTVNTTGPQGFALIGTGDINAQMPAPTISSITPNSGDTDTVVPVNPISGTGFVNGATVKLQRVSQPDINATSVVVVNSADITCQFDLTNAQVGAWDVVVTNPDTQTATLSGGFTVTVTCMPGDMNNDGFVDGNDVQLFINAIENGGGSQRQLCSADVNGDSLRDGLDVEAFINCLLGGSCP